jgi:hypothetical protein
MCLLLSGYVCWIALLNKYCYKNYKHHWVLCIRIVHFKSSTGVDVIDIINQKYIFLYCLHAIMYNYTLTPNTISLYVCADFAFTH